MLCLELPAKFFNGVRGGVHLTAEALLGALEGRGELGKPRLPDHHEVDVAFGTLEGPGHGPVDKGHANPRPNRRKHSAEEFDNPGGLRDHGLKVEEERACTLGTEVDTVALSLLAQDAGRGQGSKRLLEA